MNLKINHPSSVTRGVLRTPAALRLYSSGWFIFSLAKAKLYFLRPCPAKLESLLSRSIRSCYVREARTLVRDAVKSPVKTGATNVPRKNEI